MSLVERVAGLVTRRSRLVVALLLVATLAVGSGAGMVEQSASLDAVASESETAAADDYVRENFSARDGNTTAALFAVENPDGNVLSRASLLRSLRFQQRLRANETVNRTLVENRSTVGVANAVARAAIAAEQPRNRRGSGGSDGRSERSAAPPTLDEQVAQLESMNASAVESTVGRVLAADGDGSGRAARRLLPRGYDPGATTADARLIVVTFRTEQLVRAPPMISEPVVAGHFAARDIATAQSGPERYRAFGEGYFSEQQNAAIGDSLAILGPLAMLFVLAALSVAYRDPLDVALGLVGVVLVLVWTFGAMGWAGIEFNQMMIAVPLLLIGLSVDYALHVVMRYRERRTRDGESVRTAMARSLGGVGTALVLVTATTAVGFLANLTSSMPDLRLFGVVTAVGVGATLVVFGLFVPALKTELDAALAARGFDRARAPFGTGGRFGRLLSGGATLARRAPLAVLVVALVASAAAGYAALGVDVSSSDESFMADDPPGWTDDLPEAIRPGEYFLDDNREAIFARFQAPDTQAAVLVRGNVTRPDALERVDAAAADAGSADVTFERPTGDPAVSSPVSAIQRVATRNETFNATVAAADTDGDGVPDRNLVAIYDGLYAAAPDLASRSVHRVDGEYVALRLRVAVEGTAPNAAVAEQLRAVADDLEGGGLTATATGAPVVTDDLDSRLATTIVESMAVTLVALLCLLAVVFRAFEGSASLGAVTLAPVAVTVAWLIGTMAALDLSLNLITALVGSISLGLGVDYAIHVTERFADELAASDDPGVALERTVTGTGGALLSSAITTAAGFGVLGFSLLPALRQFGLVLALGISYAFLASVVVLPSLLALWTRYGADRPVAAGEPAVPGDD
ncbi:efflux RND transporter permease subunit [Halosimplex amylolyticum]|uniref:efflux RND transporter permease subunit n=1 Tax=Halosimplex amylolyticum TaxID=3396616 RepID=UPI003F547EC8